METANIPDNSNYTNDWHQEAHNILSSIQAEFNLEDKVHNSAIQILNTFSTETESTSTEIIVIACTAMLISTRIHNVQIEQDEWIEEAINAHEYQYEIRDMDSHVDSMRNLVDRELRRMHNRFSLPIPIETPTDYLWKAKDELDFSEKEIDDIETLLDQVTNSGIHSGRSPSAITAAAIYICLNEQTENPRYKQQEIASAVGTTQASLRNNRDRIRSTLNIDELVTNNRDEEVGRKAAINIIKHVTQAANKDPTEKIDHLSEISDQVETLGTLFNVETPSDEQPDFHPLKNTPTNHIHADDESITEKLFNIELLAKEAKRELSKTDMKTDITRIKYSINLLNSTISDILNSHYTIAQQQ